MTSSEHTAHASRHCPDCGRRYGAHVQYCGDDGHLLIDAAAVCELAFSPTAAATPAAGTPESRPSLSHVIAGRYLKVRPLGDGGQGQVWLVQDIQTDRMLALKHFQDEVLDRCRAELLAAARIEDHTHIVKLFDLHRDDAGGSFITMEFLEGETLEARLLRAPALSRTEAVDILLQMARGLREMHDKGLVHRDIKPANVMLERRPVGSGRAQRWHAKLLDLGIAKSLKGEPKALTMAGWVVGTLGYAAPEQLRGEAVTPAFDMYALGVVAHELLIGSHPMESLNPAATTRRPPLPLRRLIDRMMAEAPGERPESIAEVIDTLEAFQGAVGHQVAHGAAFARAGGKRGLAEAVGHEGAAPKLTIPRSRALPRLVAAAAALLAFAVPTLETPLGASLPLPWTTPGTTTEAPTPGVPAAAEVALAEPHWQPDVCTPGIFGSDSAC